MAHLFAAPLGWKARGFIQNDQMIVHVYHRILDHLTILVRNAGLLGPLFPMFGGGDGWNAHLLTCLDPRCGFAACAINPQLAFATHLFNANLTEVWKQPLEPTVQTLIRVLRRNHDTLNTAHYNSPLAKNTPMKSATTAPITETAT